MTQRLEPEDAIIYARRLALMHGFPAWPQATVQVADTLRQLCHGTQTAAGRSYDPRQQAEWTVRSIEDSWAAWPGLGAIRRTYARMFRPPIEEDAELGPVAEQASQPKPAPEPVCPECQSFGIVLRNDRFAWCSCPDAETLRQQAPDVVDRLNGARERRQVRPPARPRYVRAALAADLARRQQRTSRDKEGKHADQ